MAGRKLQFRPMRSAVLLQTLGMPRVVDRCRVRRRGRRNDGEHEVARQQSQYQDAGYPKTLDKSRAMTERLYRAR